MDFVRLKAKPTVEPSAWLPCMIPRRKLVVIRKGSVLWTVLAQNERLSAMCFLRMIV